MTTSENSPFVVNKHIAEDHVASRLSKDWCVTVKLLDCWNSWFIEKVETETLVFN